MRAKAVEEAIAKRKDWREADLHDLRIRYSALLLDIAIHRRERYDDKLGADARLWSVLDKEGF